MGPLPSTPVNPPCVPSTPVQKPSTPPRISAGVSPIRVQRTTPSRTFISRGVSPPALVETLPPSLAAWLHEVSQMETIAPWDSLPPMRAEATAISVTDSENEDKRSLPRSLIRTRSPEVVPEMFPTDALVCPRYPFVSPLLTRNFQTRTTLWEPSKTKRRKVRK
jgi:hypothetical protein